MNKHAISEHSLGEFLRDFASLQDCLDKCGEVIVKSKFHIGCYVYKAKVWSENMEGDKK